MHKIDRYIVQSFLSGCLPVLLLLLTLFSLLSLSEEIEDVGDGAYELIDALLVVLYSLPALIVDLLPATALLGGLLGMGALANHQELTALRAAAISPIRISRPILLLAGLLIMLILLLQSLIIPLAENNAMELRAKTLVQQDLSSLNDELEARRDAEFWTRSQQQFIRIGAVRNGRELSEVEIYQFTSDGEPRRILQARSALLLQDNTWLLQGVRDTSFDETRSTTSRHDSRVWTALLSAEQAQRLISPASTLAPIDLWRSIQRLEDNGMNTQSRWIILWKQVSASISMLGMALLALPFLLGSVRSVPIGQRMAWGGLIGISFYLVQQISGHMAGIIQWNVAVIVLAPGVLVLATAMLLLHRVNRASH